MPHLELVIVLAMVYEISRCTDPEFFVGAPAKKIVKAVMLAVSESVAVLAWISPWPPPNLKTRKPFCPVATDGLLGDG